MIFIFYDWFFEDVNITARKLPITILKEEFKIADLNFMHVDFVTAKDADDIVYIKILTEMNRIVKENS